MLKLSLETLLSRESFRSNTKQELTVETNNSRATDAADGIKLGEEQTNASVVSISSLATRLNRSSETFFGKSAFQLAKIADIANRLYVQGAIEEEEFVLLATRESQLAKKGGVLAESVTSLENALQKHTLVQDDGQLGKALASAKKVLEGFFIYGEAVDNQSAKLSVKEMSSQIVKITEELGGTVFANINTLLKMAESLSQKNQRSAPMQRYLDVLNV